MPTRARALAGVLISILMLAAAACSSSTPADNPNYVAVDANDPTPAPAVVSNEQPAPVPSAPTGDDATSVDSSGDIDTVVRVFDDFLALRAKAIVGEAELAQLEQVATPTAIEQVAALRAENETRIANESYAAQSDLAEWSNITRVDKLGDQLLFRDCTEQQYLTPGGFTVVNFVTNDVSIIEVDGELKVDEIIVMQDGVVSLGPESFGCIPPSFAARAEQTAALAVATAATLVEDPGTALAQGLPDVFAEDARADLDYGLQTLNTGGLSRVADESVTYEVLGLDVNRPDFTAVVSVCRTYPTGRSYVDASGQSTASELPAGSSYEEWVYVDLAVDGTPDRVVSVEDRGPNCEGR